MLLVHIDLFLKRKQLKKKTQSCSLLVHQAELAQLKTEVGMEVVAWWHFDIILPSFLSQIIKVYPVIPTVPGIVGVYICLVQIQNFDCWSQASPRRLICRGLDGFDRYQHSFQQWKTYLAMLRKKQI